MSMRKTAANFAHLLGLSARAEEDDESRKGKRVEEEDDDKKSRRAEEDDADDKDDKDDEKGKKAKKAKRAEDDSDEDDDAKKSRRAEEDDDKDEDKSKRSKKAKKADDDDDMEDDDDDEDEMKGNSASAKARRRERARCAAIFGSPAAAGIPHVAANLAFNTDMSRKEAISVLRTVAASAPPSRRGNLAERMSTQSVVHVGADGGKSNPSGMSPVAAAIVAAGEKARGGK